MLPCRLTTTVGTKYLVDTVIGQGAYGVVCSALHRETSRRVAIKKIQPFDHVMFALRTLREIKLLKYFQESGASENIISILDVVRPSTLENFREVYLVQELMETDVSCSFFFIVLSSSSDVGYTADVPADAQSHQNTRSIR